MGEPSSSSPSITRHPQSSQSQKDLSGCPSGEDLARDLQSADLQGARTSSGPCQQCQPTSAGGSAACPHHTYSSDEAVPLAAEGGYLYSPAQDRMPLQTVRSPGDCVPVAYCRYSTSRRRCMIVCLVIFCFLLFVLTIVFVIIFVALRPWA